MFFGFLKEICITRCIYIYMVYITYITNIYMLEITLMLWQL